ncbi:MAG: hypothetical protein Kow00124_04640 [Anaerolineae bacterium]
MSDRTTRIQQTPRDRYPEAFLLAGVFLILGIIYSMATPVFEASDEIFHYPVVQHIATTGTLPVQQVGVETLWEQEGSQPPLYYLISAGLTAWIDTGDMEAVRRINPHAKLGIPLDTDNKNMVIHTGSEQWPWRGTVLAVHILRFFGVALGAISVLLAHELARAVWPGSRPTAFFAAALMALRPMFLFIAASVNNDNLIVPLATWIMLLVVRILCDGLTARRAVTLAVAASLATITKISGLTLLPVIGLAFLIHALRTGRWRDTILAGLALVGIWAALAGWWYARNVALYGELLGINMQAAIAGGREITLLALAREWYGFWVSYWGLFGAVNILMTPWAYRLYGLLTIAGLLGLGWWVVGQIRRRAWASLITPGVLAAQVALTFVGIVRWTMTTYASQGRLMFPAMASMGALTAFGLLNWLPERGRRAAATGAAGVLLIPALLTPPLTIAPAYTAPSPIEAVPREAAPLDLHFGPLEIIAAQAEGAVMEEGGQVPITLYVRLNEPTDEDISLYVQVYGRGMEQIGKLDTYPGGGTLPTSLMEPGLIYGTRYLFEIDRSFAAPTVVRGLIGAGRYEEGGYTILQPTGADGSPRPSPVIELGVAYPRDMVGCALPPDGEPIAFFGENAGLSTRFTSEDYAAGAAVPVTLIWDARVPTPQDLTVFVHLVDNSGNVITQADRPPLNGDYPTRLWQRPCAFEDTHTLILPESLPAGSYSVLVGLYDAADPAFTRVPAAAPDGTPYPNAAVPVGTIRVEE